MFRKVKVNHWDGKSREELFGKFHCWGVAYEEFEAGPGNYSIYIVELESGKIITGSPEDVTFID